MVILVDMNLKHKIHASSIVAHPWHGDHNVITTKPSLFQSLCLASSPSTQLFDGLHPSLAGSCITAVEGLHYHLFTIGATHPLNKDLFFFSFITSTPNGCKGRFSTLFFFNIILWSSHESLCQFWFLKINITVLLYLHHIYLHISLLKIIDHVYFFTLTCHMRFVITKENSIKSWMTLSTCPTYQITEMHLA